MQDTPRAGLQDGVSFGLVLGTRHAAQVSRRKPK